MKRGATVVNFVLIIGLLFIGTIVIVNLQKVVTFQTKQVEVDVAKQFVKDIKAIVERGQSYPSDMSVEVKVPFLREYDLEITQGLIRLYFPREDLAFEEPFSAADLNLIPSKFSNSGVIRVYTKHRNFLVTDIVNKNLLCNIGDTKCDPGCAIEERCDPECYDSFMLDVCNPYCIDQPVDGVKDGVTDGEDFDGVCDHDCYNNNFNGGYYDVDCIESGDGICDPDTNNVADYICDGDCTGKDGICDPDCGRDDIDCPYVVGDDVCEIEKGENCKVSEDCLCEDGKWCVKDCVDYEDYADEMGCVPVSLLKTKNQLCKSPCDCKPGLECTADVNDENKKACCASGEYYVEGRCIDISADEECWAEEPFNEVCETEPACCECAGNAYLHGNLWDIWYNIRVPCDKEHKAFWLCEKFNSPSACASQRLAYQNCDIWTTAMNAPDGGGICVPNSVCNAHGFADDYMCAGWPYCEPRCVDDALCTTALFNYDNLKFMYYGFKWSGDTHTSLTIKIYDYQATSIESPNPIVDLSTHSDCHCLPPGEGFCSDGNPDLSPDQQCEWYAGTYYHRLSVGSGYVAPWVFGCINIPTNRKLTAILWIGFDQPILIDQLTPEPGKHYLWGIKGIEEWSDFDRGECVGPPKEVYNRLPSASCSTAT
ncbi:hypothetical protein KY320_03935 [Candidatus Woesearchaeota archaeon]|nr:hypothetical protein [Candidatus Woesearchaeota archaeon]